MDWTLFICCVLVILIVSICTEETTDTTIEQWERFIRNNNSINERDTLEYRVNELERQRIRDKNHND